MEAKMREEFQKTNKENRGKISVVIVLFIIPY